MNRSKWANFEIPLSVLALKLCEEAAEVGTEITDMMVNPGGLRKPAILNEIEHTEFLCKVLRARIQGEDEMSFRRRLKLPIEIGT